MVICNSNIILLEEKFSPENTYKGCGDVAINLDDKLITELLDINSVDEFERVLTSELIDVKNRQTISSYPTLRLLYERYLNGFNCTTKSNGYTYDTINNISKLVGTYWVDLVEQFVPSTTIWGGGLIYRNTIFDRNKHQYKKNTTFFCDDPSNDFPFSAISNSCDVEVIKSVIKNETTPTGSTTPFDSNNFFTCETNNYCNCVYTMTNNCGSEFIGKIFETNNTNNKQNNNLSFNEYNIIKLNVNKQNTIQTYDNLNNLFTSYIKILNSGNDIELNLSVSEYGPNNYGISFSLIKIDNINYKLIWQLPVSTPILNNINDYNVKPLFTLIDVINNIEIGKLFTYQGNI